MINYYENDNQVAVNLLINILLSQIALHNKQSRLNTWQQIAKQPDKNISLKITCIMNSQN